MTAPLQLGRYSLFAQLAAGGMATVYLGRLNGEVGFGRTVAIKRLHPHLAREPEFVTMFLDEAHLAARIRHPNVASTLDIVTSDDELFLVMEYIEGESLGALLRATHKQLTTIPVPVVAAIVIGLLSGLHAAHEATDEEGHPLRIIHRDVSPQNVLVGADGVPRLVDFGVARASSRLAVTRDGQLKGKVPYMAPEQLGGVVSRQTDIYAAGVVLWEALTCRHLYRGDTDAELFLQVMEARVKPPSRYNPEVSPALDRIVMKAVAKEPAERWDSAHAMAEALDAALRPASAMRVGEWVAALAGPALKKKSALVAQAESESRGRTPSARAAGSLPVLDAADDLLSDPDAVPTRASGRDATSRDSASIARPLTREAPRRSAAPPAWTYGAVLASAVLLGIAALIATGNRAGPRPSEVSDGSGMLAAPISAPPAPDPAPSASSPWSAASAPAHPPSPQAPSTQRKAQGPRPLPAPRASAGRPSSTDLQDLLDTR